MLVSAIIPNYNHAPYLPERLRSVLAQTHAELEVIVLDDASTDDSLSVIRQFERDPRMTHVSANAANSGSAFCQWNAGAAKAKGEFLWFAESDDVADPRFLEMLLGIIAPRPNIGIAYCASNKINERGQVVGNFDAYYADLDPHHWQTDFINDGRAEARDFLCFKNTLPNASAALIRREAFAQTGGADESFTLCGDWDVYAKILRGWDIAYCATPLNAYREHGNSVRSRSRGVALTESARVVSRILNTFEIPSARRAQIARRFARYWWWMGSRGGLTPAIHRAALRESRAISAHMGMELARAAPAIALRRLSRK
ncbi:MAG TPA: glycosyltransferase [Thermoflexales bacterium]|nr:glycosyltransferase [Thermoflexales bacterium]HQX75128.1 glycosyltransferase [Thermoflexales bacterium]HQZ21254.1 glycosyltransferase [Thermoflexales bacterium]